MTEKAPDILIAAADLIQARAEQRDHPDGERSIPRAVNMFNDLTQHQLSHREGWILMALLKLSRAQGGRFVLDDYIDACAYIALAGEAEGDAQAEYRKMHVLFNSEDRESLAAAGRS